MQELNKLAAYLKILEKVLWTFQAFTKIMRFSFAGIVMKKQFQTGISRRRL